MLDKYPYCTEEISYVGVGGLTKGFLKTSDVNKVQEKILEEKKIKYIGNTSNTLFSFDYYDGFFIKFVGKRIEVEDEYIVCESGVSLSFLASFSMKFNISSFYTLSLIPGLLGGALVTNAGAYGKNIADDLLFVEVITNDGKYKIIKREEIIFSYHSSSLKNESYFIFRAYFRKRTSSHDLSQIISFFEYKKLSTQDYKVKSFGSTFQNVNFLPIGKLISTENNLINFSSKCKFSSIHGNFLSITPYVHYENILKLIESTSLLLYNKLGFDLEKEIEIIE
ncbi:MAG: FAD-binding protein [Bacilli bacterium]